MLSISHPNLLNKNIPVDRPKINLNPQIVSI